jgi:nitronate monooxygenase
MTSMRPTWLTDRFSLRTPIVGAPMAGVAGGRLAAAISTAGALGMIGVGSTASADFVTSEARAAASAARPFGIGLMAWALARNPGQFDATIAARPALVSVSFGDYRPYVRPLQDAGITVATQVGDVDEALAAADAGVDVIVARGSEAGGHGLDRVSTFPLLQAVLDRVDLPVVAAGGIVTGRGLAAALAAGAAGVWVGTAFLACPEAANTAQARAAVCAAGHDATVYTRVFDIAQRIPWPAPYGGRALANRFTQRWHGHESALAADADAAAELARAKSAGDYDVAYIYAGQGVGSVTAERSAADVVASMTAQATKLLDRR